MYSDQNSLNAADSKWTEINIGEQRFTISSSHGEERIKDMADMVTDVYQTLGARSQGQSSAHIAMLTALNLAAELLVLREETETLQQDQNDSIKMLIAQLQMVLSAPNAVPDDTTSISAFNAEATLQHVTSSEQH